MSVYVNCLLTIMKFGLKYNNMTTQYTLKNFKDTFESNSLTDKLNEKFDSRAETLLNDSATEKDLMTIFEGIHYIVANTDSIGLADIKIELQKYKHVLLLLKDINKDIDPNRIILNRKELYVNMNNWFINKDNGK